MNKTIIVPNTIMLTIAAFVHEHVNNFFARSAINIMLMKEPIFVTKTIHQFLWDNTSPLVELVKPFIPSTLFPRTNIGMLYNYFYPEKMRFNVNIGTKHGFKEFFKINSLNYKPYIIGFKDSDYEDCKIYSIQEGRDGTGLPPYFNKDEDVINAYTFMIPRTYPTIYSKDIRIGGLDIYDCRFQEGIYKRLNNSQDECLGRTGSSELPEGLIDTSKIVFGVPFALSPPHFYGYKGVWNNYIRGLNGSDEEHGRSIGTQIYEVLHDVYDLLPNADASS
uniref:Uncharacterized protein n=1 Tax=Megaselia scalaris TaxID=36166 RepID=T1GEK1_MEGSC